MADVADLKSAALIRACGFESHPGHPFRCVILRPATGLIGPKVRGKNPLVVISEEESRPF